MEGYTFRLTWSQLVQMREAASNVPTKEQPKWLLLLGARVSVYGADSETLVTIKPWFRLTMSASSEDDLTRLERALLGWAEAHVRAQRGAASGGPHRQIAPQ